MKISILAATLVAALALPIAAFASDDDSAMTTTATSPNAYGVVVCRVAKPGEKINARMVNQPLTLVCKPLDPKAKMATIGKVVAMSPKKMGPDLTGVLTVEQANAAWTAYLDRTLMIPTTP